MRASKTIFLALLLCTVAGCKNNKKNQLIFPFPNISVPYQSFLVDPIFGGHIYLQDGSQIMVPPYAFADAEGKVVEQTVTISIRRFNTGAALVTSGLPIPDNGDGKRKALTASFEIKAFSNQTNIMVAEGKELQVLHGCNCALNAYDVFYYRSPEEAWEPQDLTYFKVNMVKRELQAQPLQVPPPPAEIAAAEAEDSLVNIDYPLYRVPALRMYPRISWKYVDGEFPEEEAEKLFLKKDTISQNYLYVAVTGEDTFVATITPRVLPRDSADARMRYDRALAQWQKANEAVQFEAENLDQLSDYLYEVPIKQFGYYGLTEEMPGTAEAAGVKFLYKGKEVKPRLAYVLSPEGHLLNRLQQPVEKLIIRKKNEALLLLIFENNQAAVIPKEKFTQFKGGELEVPELRQISSLQELQELLTI